MHVAGAARVGFVVGCFGVSDSVKVLIKLVNVVCHKSKTISEKQQQRVVFTTLHRLATGCVWSVVARIKSKGEG